MNDLLVAPSLIALGALVSWLSAIGLVWAAWTARPRVIALVERAVIAVLLSLFLTVYVVIAYNADNGNVLFTVEASRRVVRLTVLGLSLIAPVWLGLWLSGRLGDGS